MDVFGTAGDDYIENLNPPGVHIWLNVYGGAGNDTIKVAFASALGEAGNDTIIGARDFGPGDGGHPTASYANSPAGIRVDLRSGVAQDGFGTTDTLQNIHSVRDSAHSDLIIGSSGSDEFILGRGSDTVFGAGGSDMVVMDNVRSTGVTTTYHIGTDTFTLASAAGDMTTLVDIAQVRFFGPYSDHATISVTGAGDAGERYLGGYGTDIVHSGKGDDTIDAGAGTDVVVYSGNRAGYTVARTETGVSVSGALGNDTLVQVERLHFGDAGIAFDTAGVPGQVYRLYEAAFDRVPEAFGLGFWIAMMDKGVTLNAVANGFVASQEFKDMYSGASNAEVVAKLYTHILDRAGDLAGISHWSGVLDRKEATMAEVLAGFSESAEFIAKLAGVMEAGVEFTPYG